MLNKKLTTFTILGEPQSLLEDLIFDKFGDLLDPWNPTQHVQTTVAHGSTYKVHKNSATNPIIHHHKNPSSHSLHSKCYKAVK